MMALDQELILAMWERCTADWQAAIGIGDDELRALCAAGLVELRVTSKWKTTSSRFPEVVTTVYHQAGYVTDETKRIAFNFIQHFPAEWFTGGQLHVRANEQSVKLDAVKLTEAGVNVATLIRDGTLDQADVVDLVQGVSDGDPHRVGLAEQAAFCELLDSSIARPVAEPVEIGKPIAVQFPSNATFAAGAQDRFIERLAASLAKTGHAPLPMKPEPGKSAETSAETPKIKSPISPNLVEFIAYLKRVKPPNGGQTEAAREFCRKNGLPLTKAKNLIRQARDYPDLW